MLGIRFCECGCGSQSGDPFVCFGAKLTQRACVRDYLRDQKRTREGRSQSSQLNEAVKRRRQNREVDRTGQSTKVVGSWHSREKKGRLLVSVDSEAGLAIVIGCVSVPSGFVGISLEYTPALAHRCTESYAKVSQTSPFLRLELTQVRVCLFVLFSSTLFVVYIEFCVSVKKCEIPLAGDERNQ